MFFSRKSISSVFALILVVLLIAGCGTSNPEANKVAAPAGGASASESKPGASTERTIKHLSGETKISGTPQKVIAMEYGLLSSAISLGVTPIAFPGDDSKDTLKELGFETVMKDYKSIGVRTQPNLELIRTLKPDLIIGDFDRHKTIYEELAKIAPTILLPDMKAKYQDAVNNHITIGEALNKKTEAAQHVAEHKSKLEAIKKKAPKNLGFLLVSLGEKDLNPRTDNFFQPDMLKTAGFNYVLKGQNPQETAIKASMEQMLLLDPDVMIITNDQYMPTWEKNPLWQELKAVKSKNIFTVNHSKWSFNRSFYGANIVLDELNVILGKLK